MRGILRLTLCAMLAGIAACGDDVPRETFVFTNDGGDGDGDGDDDAGADASRERRGYERLCTIASPHCTEDELEPARDCYSRVCRSEYMECDFPCSSLIKCLDACDCADRRCVANCDEPPECVECLNSYRCDPMRTCEPLLPACWDETTQHSCAELATCCPDLHGVNKAECESAAQGDDEGWCSVLYGGVCEQPR